MAWTMLIGSFNIVIGTFDSLVTFVGTVLEVTTIYNIVDITVYRHQRIPLFLSGSGRSVRTAPSRSVAKQTAPQDMHG